MKKHCMGKKEEKNEAASGFEPLNTALQAVALTTWRRRPRIVALVTRAYYHYRQSK